MRGWIVGLAGAFVCGVFGVQAAQHYEVKIFEAESATLQQCKSVSAKWGSSAGAHVAGFTAQAGSKLTFTVPAQQDGPHELSLSYLTGWQAASVNVSVNGVVQPLDLEMTSGMKEWAQTVFSAELTAGDNSIEISQNGAGKRELRFDYLTLGNVHKVGATLTQTELAERMRRFTDKTGCDGMVVVARTFINSSHTYTYFNEGFQRGGGLYHVTKDGFQRLVDAGEGRILDAELSYDGTQILFSWKKDRDTNYDLYVINLDGTGLRQLTQHPSNNFNASWLPDGGIAFLSDRDNNYAYCHGSSSAVLYRMEPDGSGLKRLSANYLSDIAPHVGHDGKIMYTRWEYVDRFQIPCQGLWAQNPDGTGLKHIFGGRLLDPVMVSEAKSIPGTKKILVTMTGHNGPICGSIGVLDPAKGANNPDSVQELLGPMVRLKGQAGRGPEQKYEYPYPVDENYFLVSNDGAIELVDYQGKSEVLFSNNEAPALGELGFYAAMPVKTRQREPVVQSSLPETAEPIARLIMQDVYIGLEKEIAAGTIKRGDIKQIRVVGCMGKQDIGDKGKSAFCWQFPVVSAGATMEPKKTFGLVDIEADGSAMFEVPAMRPVILQALDAEGRTIQRMRTFAQFMPGEVQSCTGCHMDRNTAVPPATGNRVLALQQPIQKMEGAPWNEHKLALSYVEQVQPVWDRNCVKCHNARRAAGDLDLSGDRTDLFNVSYDNLVRTGPNRNPSMKNATTADFTHRYISYIPSYNSCEPKYMADAYFEPFGWGTYKSRLAKLIRSGHPDAKGNARIALTDLEKRTVFAWIDYNVPYYPTSHTNHPDLRHGMRELVPAKFDELLTDVVERRCIDCHNQDLDVLGWFNWNDRRPWKDWNNFEPEPRKLPLKHYLRWEKPELNNFMLAPLAKSAGGVEMDGQFVFKDKNDPDYQKLLRAFDAIHKRVEKLPRMDMPGAEEVRGSRHLKLYQCKEQP